MDFSPFSYQLPKELIAERPVYPYDCAKLLIVDRARSQLKDSTFAEIPRVLGQKDVLVFNDSGVRKSRLLGRWADSEGEVEVLLLRPQGKLWLSMGRPLKRFKEGKTILFDGGQAIVHQRVADKEILLEFQVSGDFDEWLRSAASMPIPPYIRSGRGDKQDDIDYQTTFARDQESVAASTAALHFTADLLAKIKSQGTQVQFINLHLGPASFLPVLEEGSSELKAPGRESFYYCENSIRKMLALKESGHRIIAVGTSVVRALESGNRLLKEGAPTDQIVSTELFIKPGFKFEIVDALVTNFHQPGTTHLMLVEALVGADLISKAYCHALKSSYRFLSYGDGMFIC